MDKKRIFSMFGIVILLCGVFSPVLRVPEMGDVSYFLCGKGDGTVVILLALISLLLSLKKNYKALWITGVACAGVIVFSYVDIHARMAAGSAGFADAYHFSWGWAVLLLGAASVLASAAVRNDLA
jgi:hypothetical protein